MWYALQVEITFLGGILDYFAIVGNNNEVFRTQIFNLTGTSHEVHLHFGRECTQYFALGQIQTLDGYTVNVLLCQYVREELNVYTFWHDLDIVGMTESATDSQRISETGIVKRFGIYGTDAVLFIR